MYFHSTAGFGCPAVSQLSATDSLTALVILWLKLATAAGTGDCGVSETISESGPSPERVEAETQKL